MKKLYTQIFWCFCLFAINNSHGQNYFGKQPTIPQMRQIFHDNIDEAQKKVLKLNCGKDSVFNATKDVNVNLQITYLLKNKIDYLQWFIETDSAITEPKKFTWLRGVNDVLTDFISQRNLKRINDSLLGSLIIAYEDAMKLEINNQSFAPVIQKNEEAVGGLLISNFALKNNIGVASAENILLFKFGANNPQQIMKLLTKYPDLPGGDSLIIQYAYTNPQNLYNFAAAKNTLGIKIRSIKEPMVSTISRMANSEAGRFLFPFLDEILLGNISIEEIQKTALDDEAYYKLLVKTELVYEVKKQQGKKPVAMKELTEKLRSKAIELYINEINALHDEPIPSIRFNKIKNLNIQELYFLAVLGETELYTSSFVNGVYPKIMEQLGKSKSDSLMQLVKYDHFRKFIKMCAGYNTLDDYLGKMDKPVAENMIRSFVDELGESVEEAVDVADSYASIKDSSIRKIALEEINKNYEQYAASGNKKSKVVYGLLKTLFTSIDTTAKKDSAIAFKVPNVYQLTVPDLKDENAKIPVQQFFYGDKDGAVAFSSFISTFRSNGWKVVNKEEWVEVSNSSNTPIVIYANKPLDETKDLDELAQQHLNNYLDSLGIYPTIAIHRGHSYYVKSSINQLTSSARLVILGSCGGYHNLSQVLSICPKAHIIASKQVGTGAINIVLIEYILETLKQNKDIDWPATWKTIEQKFAKKPEIKERFDDYIPPHKNLGAIFIMAYYKALEAEMAKP